MGRAGACFSQETLGAGGSMGQGDTCSGLCLYSEKQMSESDQSLPQGEAASVEVIEGSLRSRPSGVALCLGHFPPV